MLTPTAEATTPGATPRADQAADIASFTRWLRYRGRSRATVEGYVTAVNQFIACADRLGMPRSPLSAIAREHIETWLVELGEQHSSGTVRTRYNGLRQFFAWALDYGELRTNPMARIEPPRVIEQPHSVLAQHQLRAVIDACRGPRFQDIRDEAILRTLLDTGIRRAELVGILLEERNPRASDVDLDAGLLRVLGKGARLRTVPIGQRTTAVLDRYIRARRRRRHADHPEL